MPQYICPKCGKQHNNLAQSQDQAMVCSACQPHNIARDTLAVVEANWVHHSGVFDTPYDEATAIEIILNEMIDYAINAGYSVQTPALSMAGEGQEVTELIVG
jgi:hypothetical protein